MLYVIIALVVGIIVIGVILVTIFCSKSDGSESSSYRDIESHDNENKWQSYRRRPIYRRTPKSKGDSGESIIAAIYKDKGLDYCKNWIFFFFNVT